VIGREAVGSSETLVNTSNISLHCVKPQIDMLMVNCSLVCYQQNVQCNLCTARQPLAPSHHGLQGHDTVQWIPVTCLRCVMTHKTTTWIFIAVKI